MEWFEIVAVICLVEWGLIHIAAYFAVGVPAWGDKLSSTGVYQAADTLMAVPEYKAEYDSAIHPRMSGKILWQHGFNLGWSGVWCGVLCPIYIANHNREAWVMTMVPYLIDWGYFVAFDWFKLGGVIAQAQTYIVSIGSILTAVSVNKHHVLGDTEFIAMVTIPSLLMFFGILEKLGITDVILKSFGMKTRADYDAMGPRVANSDSPPKNKVATVESGTKAI